MHSMYYFVYITITTFLMLKKFFVVFMIKSIRKPYCIKLLEEICFPVEMMLWIF